MYLDYSSYPNWPPSRNYRGFSVVVLEGGEKAKDVILFARRHEVTSVDADGDEIFWVVFPDDPKRIWDFTGRALRRTLWNARRKAS